jgi:hypothetical protein
MMVTQGRITPAMDGTTQLEGITMTYRTEKMLEELKARRERERRLALCGNGGSIGCRLSETQQPRRA